MPDSISLGPRISAGIEYPCRKALYCVATALGDTTMKRKPDLLERLKKFDAMPDAEKIEVRMAWLEKKLLGVLYLLINAASILMAFVASLLVREMAGIDSYWLLGPVFFITWLGVAVWAHRRTFRGSPPHLDFVDPDL